MTEPEDATTTGTDDPRAFLEDRAQRAEEAYARYADVVRADPDYPRFHLAPPVGRLNDPNGLILIDGVYHAFYQYSPLHPEKAVFWRHATSTDLSHWTDRGTAIEPVDWFDRDGCYSGSAIRTGESTVDFFYTGNVRGPSDEREAYQCRFVSEDAGRTFVKDPGGPVIRELPAGYTAHHRDPFVFRSEAGYSMLLGAQHEDRVGAVVRYDSTDLRSWTFAGPLVFDRLEIQRLGYMDECPTLIRMTDEATGAARDVLIFCPQGMEPEGDSYRNVFQCGYVVGNLEGTAFTGCSEFRELDAGFEFYATQVFAETGTRAILMAWIGNAGEDNQPSLDHHWVHMMTYPRELRLRDGYVFQRPVRELDAVLPLAAPDGPGADVVLADTLVGGMDVDRLRGEPRHRLSFRALVGTRVESAEGSGWVEVAYRDARGDAVILRVDAEEALVDRSGTRYTAGETTRRRALEPSAEHDVEILMDGSSLEVFLDDGACTFTLRAYVEDFDGVALRGAGDVEIRDLRTAVLR